MIHLYNVTRWALHPYRSLIRRLFFAAPDAETVRIKHSLMEGIEKEQTEIARELRTLQAAVSVYQRRPYRPRTHGGS